MTDEEQRVEAAKRQAALNKKRAEEKLDQDPERNKQLEDMRQGDFLQDPEQSNAFYKQGHPKNITTRSFNQTLSTGRGIII